MLRVLFIPQIWLIISLLLSVVGNAFPIQVQPVCLCFVKGQVFDRETHQPIPGATILIKETGQGMTTNTVGQYRIDRLCEGTYTLVARIVGYREVQQTLTLKHDVAEASRDVLLSEDVHHLQNVTVTAQKTDALTSQSVMALQGRTLDQTRGLTLGDALRNVPGVTTLQTGSSVVKPVIHGMHSSRVLILNNGIRQEGQQWGSEHGPEIDPFVATRLSVIKGAAGVRYGSDAIGGVILVEPALLPTAGKLHGQLNLAGFSNGQQGVVSAQTEGSVGRQLASGAARFGWRVQGTVKTGGNMKTPTYFLDNTGVRERNGSAAFIYRGERWHSEVFYSRFSSEIGIFSGSHIGSLTDLQQVLDSGEPLVKSGFSYAIGRPSQAIVHDLLKWRTAYTAMTGANWHLTLARQTDDRMEYDLHLPRNDSLASLNRPELRFQLTTYSAELIRESQTRTNRSSTMGVSGLYQYNIMTGRPLIPNFQLATLGTFWIGKERRGSWEYELGMRIDWRHLQIFRYVNRVYDSPTFIYASPSGTLGATHYHNDHWITRLNLGTAWRPPNISELFSDGVHHGAAAYEQGDAGLRPETNISLNLATEWRSDRVQAEVELYYNHIQNYIYLRPQSEPILTVRGAFPYFKYTQTNAIYTGIDATVDLKLGVRWNWTTKPSYLYVQDMKVNQPIVMIPPNRWDNSLRYTLVQPNKAGRWREPYISVGNLLVARQNRVPVNSDFAPPPPAYSLWTAAVGSTMAVSDKQSIDISLTATNLFDIQYRDYLNRFRYYANDMGRNVAIRLKWGF
ncbi:TonB-dependent receptor [Fibrella forsythiae]|uniref:TonB-dependent receptor n=1 Tax=Fibrella forsythiae TaxID=2817061 RepID=UPI00286E554F|nr:TonB-dependent receptor [Fibrella forsythiae]